MQKFKKNVTKKKLVKRGREINFLSALNRARELIIQEKPQDLLSAAQVALKAFGGVEKVIPTGIIPLPKTGGFLPLIPIFAGLSALGALSGGAAGIAKAVNDAQSARAKLDESKRHNETMEAIALGKKGSGLYLKKHKSGYGLYLKKMSKNSQ